MMDAYAATPGVMYGSVARGSIVDPGALVTINQINGNQVLIADNIAGDNGLSGLAFDDTGRLFGSQVGSVSGLLHEFNPDTGAIINTVSILDINNNLVKVNDLTVQPGTNQLYGLAQGSLYTINENTGAATLVGVVAGIVGGGIGFAPDGTLYLTSATVGSGFFKTIDPNTAGVILDIGTTIAFDGLGVRSDGTIFAARNGFDSSGADIYTISATGVPTLIGIDPSSRGISDLTFVPDIPVGGFNVPIDTTALLLAGAQSISMWMIPVVVAGVAIGVFVIKRRK